MVTMRLVFSKLLSLLFPPSLDEKILSSVTHLKPSVYTVTTPKGAKVLTCTRYDEIGAHAAIKLLKRHGNSIAAKLLAQLLSDVLLEELSDIRIWNSIDIVIIPVPTTGKRNRERGFNPLEKIFKFLPEQLRSLVATGVLIQTKSVPMQKTLTRTERFKNVKGIFTVVNEDVIRNKHVVLIDDVITTAATLDEAVHTLTKAGAEVTAVALVRA